MAVCLPAPPRHLGMSGRFPRARLAREGSRFLVPGHNIVSIAFESRPEKIKDNLPTGMISKLCIVPSFVFLMKVSNFVRSRSLAYLYNYRFIYININIYIFSYSNRLGYALRLPRCPPSGGGDG